MPYVKKYNYRRRRTSRNLRNRYIYGNKTASAQAKQIASLRNRLNWVARANKPEVKSIFSGASEFTFSNSSTSQVWQAYPGVSPGYGPGENQKIGDYIRVKNLTWNLTFEYYDDRPGDQSNPDSSGAMIRCIVLQWKNPVGTTSITNPEHILENYGSSGANYTHNIITPLKTGITELFHVLADKKYTITQNKNQIFKQIKVKPRNYRFQISDGKFNNVILMIIVSGLHWDSSLYTQYVKGSFSDKLVFTDA